MSHIRIAVNNTVLFDGQLDQWTNTPPDFIAERLKSGAKEPHMIAILVAMTEAIVTGRNANIEATTTPDEWTIKVQDVALQSAQSQSIGLTQ